MQNKCGIKLKPPFTQKGNEIVDALGNVVCHVYQRDNVDAKTVLGILNHNTYAPKA